MNTPDLAYPEHGLVGAGKYFSTLANRQPDYGGLNQGYEGLRTMSPYVSGGQFVDPQQAAQYASGQYLSNRGNLAQTNIQNMFQMAQLMDQIGMGRSNVAAMIPELKAQQVQIGSTGLFGGLL